MAPLPCNSKTSVLLRRLVSHPPDCFPHGLQSVEECLCIVHTKRLTTAIAMTIFGILLSNDMGRLIFDGHWSHHFIWNRLKP
ncbi:hypothetical protein KC19_9G053500 [Ceratodon purpureus]|uniref:Uncharacterized protein n=1 Tax=Ceratodon purpureus TaxID=3225 RepID=A0A8T0GQU5_CERPU|nr:hypothetical protein KC19_9G053500 [Ceratodon purpureus]